MIDFDFNDEKGTNVPDSSVKIPGTGWSVRWTGMIVARQSGDYAFTIDGDGSVKVTFGNQTLINKTDASRSVVTQKATLSTGQPVPITIEYVHQTGISSLHVDWSGPGLDKQPLTPQPGF